MFQILPIRVRINQNEKEVETMAVYGCEAQHATPKLEERTCPNCGEIVEVFTRKGRVVSDSACDCGYVFKEEEPVFTRQARAKDE